MRRGDPRADRRTLTLLLLGVAGLMLFALGLLGGLTVGGPGPRGDICGRFDPLHLAPTATRGRMGPDAP